MKIIAIVNQKGGAGKTPSAVQLAFALANKKHTVLFVDADPQATASLHFLGVGYKQQQPTLYNAIAGNVPRYMEPVVITETLHLLPAHDELERAEIELTARKGYLYQTQLSRLLEYYNSYEFVIIDTPGSRISIFATLALAAANLVIVPVKTEMAAQQATIDTMGLIEDVQTGGLNPGLEIWGILPNQYESNVRHHQDILEVLQEDYKGKVFEPSRKSTRYNDALAARTDIRNIEPPLGEYWDRVARSVEEKVRMHV